MTKAQIHFSNDLEKLVQIFKENLYPEGSVPFGKRLVVVPHLRLKGALMQAFAKDPELQVAAGIEVVNFSQAWSKVTKKTFPTVLELSLFLQYTLISLIEEEVELKQYFDFESKEKRIGPFCDTLARYFLRYAVYGARDLKGWQEKLWKKILNRWALPQDKVESISKWQIHLFGASFVPKSYFTFFQKLNAQMYLFSPCEIFWGDFYSDKERHHLSKRVPEHQIDFFETTFEDQNPLLANWGKVGRQMSTLVEESNLPTQEHYVQPTEEHCLAHLQRDFLGGVFSKPQMDQSLQCFSAPSLLREVEIVKDQLLNLFDAKEIQPRDVQVLSPDISLYAPYIHAAFTDIPYSIADLEVIQADEIAKAFAKLIELPKKRFALESVLQLLNTQPVKEKFDLNVELIQKWLKLANIRWGFSQSQRRIFYLQDIEKQQLVVNSDNGTWDRGLKRLLLGLGHLNGKEAPLCVIEVTEMEQFNQFYTLIHSLADDLAPLFDGTRWTMPIWLRYFACLLESYFVIDPTHDLYKQFQQLAAACDHLDKEEVSFLSIERIISQILHQKTKMHQPPHLQAIQFSSFFDGCIRPGKVIYLIGMGEEHFPRREETSSLYSGEMDYRPLRGDEDRYLFLQALMSAREAFYISYVRDREGKRGVCLPVQELLYHIEKGKVTHHPTQPFDPDYFNGTYKSYDQAQYSIAKAKQTPQKRAPLIREFYESVKFNIAHVEEREIDPQKLFKFARNPLRYYFHEILGIYPERPQSLGQEYLLDPLCKFHLVREALTTPFETVWENAEKRGELPINLFNSLAKEQLAKEVEEWQMAMEAFHIDPQTIETKKIKMDIGPVRLSGKLELMTPKGLLVKGKDCLQDRIRFWPHALIMQRLGLALIFVKDQKMVQLEGSFESYLEYFFLSEKHPSPLLLEFAKPLLEGTAADLKKAFKQALDEAWNWVLFCDGLPNAEIIHENWSAYLKKQFMGVYAVL